MLTCPACKDDPMTVGRNTACPCGYLRFRKSHVSFPDGWSFNDVTITDDNEMVIRVTLPGMVRGRTIWEPVSSSDRESVYLRQVAIATRDVLEAEADWVMGL